jgi:hypothetical protein
VRFGLFTTLYDCGGGARTAADLLDNLREQVVLAEQLGYDAVWMGEHHFGPYGLGDLPNPILVGADLAVRTERIRIGQMANIAPWWHPIRLAEDLAILDNLTRGRVDVGFGRGVWPYEVAQYVARYPGRAVGFAAIDPNQADAPGELERSITGLGLRGLKLSPVYHAFDPWCPAAWRLYEMADGLRVPVMFHSPRAPARAAGARLRHRTPPAR